MSRKDIDYVRQFFKFNRKLKLQKSLQTEFSLKGQLQFICKQIKILF